jgi:glutamine amidotransferase
MELRIIDTGYGNKKSLETALNKLQIPFQWVTQMENDEEATPCAYLLPGVGAAAQALKTLDQRGWTSYLKRTQKPIIGICLGFQILFETVEEGQKQNGLGLLSGDVRLLPDEFNNQFRNRPHIGWNQVENKDFYFAHSFAVLSSQDARATTDDFVSIAAKNNVLGFQFHPEISGSEGLQLLKETWQWCKSYRPLI